MSISSSLNAGVMGLAANASRLSTISDNIANSATIGYKQSEISFMSMVIQQGKSGYAAGGVTAMAYKDIAAEGSLVYTNNSTDLSIAGRGMLAVTDFGGLSQSAAGRKMMLTPSASFTTNADGYMVSQSGQYLLGWPANADGTIPSYSRSSATGMEPVNVSAAQFTAAPTTRMNLGVNLPASETVAGGSGEPFDLPIEYFNNLGSSSSLNLSFTPDVPADGQSNSWTVEIFDEAGDPTTPIGTFTVSFNDGVGNGGTVDTITAGGGATYDAGSGQLTINASHGPVDIYVGTSGSRDGLTQLDADFTPANVTKNGSPISELQAVEIDESGMLQAVYESGLRRTLYQIPVADVPNMNGLVAGDLGYSVSNNSGDVYFWDSGTGPAGTTAGYSLMESTTDIASELTDLIETQRAYSTNAKIVQTVDEMLQETTNLKR